MIHIYFLIIMALIFGVILPLTAIIKGNREKEYICNAQDIEACKECKILICPFEVDRDEFII